MTNTLTAEDVDARNDLKQDEKRLSFIQFWEQRADLEIKQPRRHAVPFIWRWADIEPRLRIAARTVPIEECERRSLTFVNPGLDPKPYATNTMIAACSLYNPGEVAPVHRHTPSALRFAVSGVGGYTVVEGEKLVMGRGDLVLTPAGTWHDHGNDGDEAVMWVDVLDAPLMEAVNAVAFEFDYSEPSATGERSKLSRQTVAKRAGHSTRRYSAGGLVPLFGAELDARRQHSPMLIYRWNDTLRALEDLRDEEGSAYDGVIVEYVDPSTGGSVAPTLSARAQLLKSGEATLAQRKTASVVYTVLEGEGYTEVDGQRIKWRRNDLFVVPGWHWHSHVVTGASDAFLFSVTDEPALRKLGAFRVEYRDSRASEN